MSRISVAIPTYNRGQILIKTLEQLLDLKKKPSEILVVDQTTTHPPDVIARLESLSSSGDIRWIQLAAPSIPHAMNVALKQAKQPIVLFIDDDVEVPSDFIEAHAHAHAQEPWAVAGQVLQPGETPQHFTNPHGGVLKDLEFPFRHDTECDIENVMAGNLSVDRDRALSIGGFDENFVGAAYRFETDFARRIITAGGRIRFVPAASLNHLHLSSGGIRAHGDHRRTASPAHSAGDYYFALWHVPNFWNYAFLRFVRNVFTKWHLRHPWAIPAKITAELRGLALAMRLHSRGRKLAE
jgi:GT2 family glycosyltransferase